MQNTETRLDQIEQLMVLNNEQLNGLVVSNQGLTESNQRSNQILSLLHNHVKDVAGEIDTLKKEVKSLKIDNEESKNQSEKVLEVSINVLRKKSQLDEYINLGRFGSCFRVKIGAKTVGKLLRVVGIAQSSKSETMPFHTKCPKYARCSVYQTPYGAEIQSFKWNYPECMKAIEKWLDKNGLLEEFYSISKEPKMETFISDLHKEHIE